MSTIDELRVAYNRALQRGTFVMASAKPLIVALEVENERLRTEIVKLLKSLGEELMADSDSYEPPFWIRKRLGELAALLVPVTESETDK